MVPAALSGSGHAGTPREGTAVGRPVGEREKERENKPRKTVMMSVAITTILWRWVLDQSHKKFSAS
jgi:hypothetical protein